MIALLKKCFTILGLFFGFILVNVLKTHILTILLEFFQLKSPLILKNVLYELGDLGH